MKEISELTFPDNVRYAEDHEWAKMEGNLIRVGISDFAQDQLGDVTFVELPEIGDSFKKNGVFGTVESTKAVADLLMPIGGEVVEVNKALEDTPELVNLKPYTEGWMIVVEPGDPEEIDHLMDREAYLKFLKESE